MNSKKILAMIVAVAMVVAIVPAFTLTAAADTTTPSWEFAGPQKSWATQNSNALKKFDKAYSGNLRFEFDMKILSDNLGADVYVGIGKQSNGNVPCYTNDGRGIAIQQNSGTSMKFGYDGGKNGGTFDVEKDSTYHVVINTAPSVESSTYKAKITKSESGEAVLITPAEGEAVEELNGLKYRSNLDSLDTLVVMGENGGPENDKAVDYVEVSNFKIYELDKKTVTVKYVYNDVEISSVMQFKVGEQYTPQGSVIYENKLYIVSDTEPREIMNETTVITIEMTPAESYVSEKGTVNDNEGISYTLGSESLVLNGTFNYGMAGWTSGNFDTPLSTDNSFSIEESKNSHEKVLKQGKSEGSGKAGSLGTRWPVEAGKTYYFAYDQMKDDETNHNGGVKFFTPDGGSAAGLVSVDMCFLGDVKLANAKDSFGDNMDGDYKFKVTTDWSRKEYMFYIPEGIGYLGMQMAWTNNTYIDNIELREAVCDLTPTTVTVKRIDEAGSNIVEPETVSTSKLKNLYATRPYTYPTPENIFHTPDYSAYYTYDAEGTGSLSIDSLNEDGASNEITLKYNSINFAPVDNIPASDSFITVDGKVYKVTDDKNLVPNASFETIDGKYSMVGWYSAQGINGNKQAFGEPSENGFCWAVGKDKAVSNTSNGGYEKEIDSTPENVHGGDFSFGSRWNDPEDGLCSILTNFAAKNNKTYYLSYYAKASTTNDCLVWAGAVKGIDAKRASNKADAWYFATDESNNDNHPVKVATDWTKIEKIITTDDVSDTIQLHAWYLGDNGHSPHLLLDDFVLIEVAELEDVYADITAIEGNSIIDNPATVLGTYSDGTVAPVNVTWNDNENIYTEPTVEPLNITGTITGTEKGINGKVTILPSDDDTNAEQFVSTKDQAGNDASKDDVKKFASKAVKGKVSFEFDVTYKTEPGSNFSVTIGNSTKNDGKAPAFNQPGNAISLQGTEGGVAFKTGKGDNTVADGAVFKVALNEKYRIYIETNTADSTYTAVARDSKGVVVAKTETLNYRRTDIDGILDSVIAITNGTGSPGDIVVENFRVAWTDGGTDFTVNAKCDGEPIEEFESFTGKYIDDSYIDIPAIEGYTYLNKSTEGNTVTLNYQKNIAVDNMFSYNIHTSGAGHLDEEANGYKFRPLSWNTPVNVIVMSFKAPIIEDGKKLNSAKLHLFAPVVNNDKTDYVFNVYAINPKTADFETGVLIGEGINPSTWEGMTDAVKLTSKTVNFPTKANESFNIDLDLSDTVISEDIVLAITVDKHELTLAGKSYASGANAPYLTNIETVADAPGAPEISLGWNDIGFTINVKSEGADTINVTPELAESVDVIINDGNDGIAITPSNTNRIYTVGGKKNNVTGETAKESVYSLVVKAVKAGRFNADNKINAEQAKATIDVVVNGGIYIKEVEGNYVLPENSIFTADGKNISIDKNLIDAGIKITELTYTTDGEAKLKAKVGDDGVIKLSEEAAAALAFEEIYLEEIEFTFEPDVIESVGADESAFGSFDFVEEI